MNYKLIIGEKPTYFEVVKQPEDFYGAVGAAVSVPTVVTGEGLVYRWYIRNKGASSWSASSIRADTYTLASLSANNNGRQLKLRITDSNGTVLETGIATIHVGTAPNITILAQPQNYHGYAGQTARFEVKASGTGLSYQWQTYNTATSAWDDIPGATAAKYLEAVIAASNNKKFRCVITDANNVSVASTEAIIMIVNPVAYFEFDVARYKVGTMALYTAVDVVGSQLSVDEMEIVVNVDVAETSVLEAVPYGTVAWIVDSAENIYAKIYFKNAERLGKTAYKLQLMSAVGFLDKMKHMGGVYAQTTAGDLIAELIGNKFAYSVDPAVSSVLVNGWLPIASARENLHRLMFALGISLTKDVNGDIMFIFLTDSAGTNVPAERIFTGARVKLDSPVTAVEVTEHSYSAYSGASEAVLFDNSEQDVVSGLLVEFSAPHFSLRATTGLTIVTSGVNYAVISGQGVLYGKPYAHETRIIRKELENVVGEENVKRVGAEDGLINALNSENVATRTLAYYSQRKTTEMTIKAEGEKPGSTIAFTDAHGASVKGLITQSNIRLSTFPKARLKIVEGYVPTGQGNFFAHRILVTESGAVTLPSGVTHIRLVLGGGGSGGAGGYNGANGSRPNRGSWGYRWERTWYDNQQAAAGGAGGSPGMPGKIFVGDVDVTDGEVLTFALGSGGAGGSVGGGAGSAGTASTVSSVSITASSADGEETHGYADPLTGIVYSADGNVGYRGGDGGFASVGRTSDGVIEHGINGGNGEISQGGAGGVGGDSDEGTFTETQISWIADGGGGGGAAYNSDGGVGADGQGDEHENDPSIYDDPYGVDIYGGNGGNGADAGAAPAVNYGCGGNGGNGGGGGGNGGCVLWSETPLPDGSNVSTGLAGSGGAGSAGGAGGGGYSIIYYN